MYVMHGYENVKGPNYERDMREHGAARPERREIIRTFRTGMGMLRFCADNGAFRGVSKGEALDRVNLGRDGQGAGADYHVVDTSFRFTVTSEHLTAMRAAHARYMVALHYWQEIEPEWREVETIPYMDNSVERHEVNKYGTTRRITLTSPSGDVCA